MRGLQQWERREDLVVSLRGLAIGDAIGSQFFVPGNGWEQIVARTPPDGFWEWTDDTEMACSVATVLAEVGGVDEDLLATSFATHFDFHRGYGPGTVKLLHEVLDGASWREAAGTSFSGSGSYGNGSAMRVAPLGAFFSDDLEAAAEQAKLSSVVTHAHPEAVSGAVAVAVAAGIATGLRRSGATIEPRDFMDEVLRRTPEGLVQKGIWKARGLFRHRQVQLAVRELGNGSSVTAADTVPIAVWIAATRFEDFKEAVWTCIQAGGDVDTTAAIVGGIVAAHLGQLPLDWDARTEALPEWSVGG